MITKKISSKFIFLQIKPENFHLRSLSKNVAAVPLKARNY